MHYKKKAFSLTQQIDQLKSRGLVIDDDIKAEAFLTNVSYYRLEGYWWPLQSDKVNHIFKPGSNFQAVVDIYEFDQKLRLLLFDAIEKIEICFRTRLIYQLSHAYGPWWFETSRLFKDTDKFKENLSLIDKELRKSREVFILEHNRKYKTPERPPSWKTLEILSFGHLSKIYTNLDNIPEKEDIAKSLSFPNSIFLESWLDSISLLRNLCAHHSRIWNRNLPRSPRIPKYFPSAWLNTLPKRNKVYAFICCIKYLLNAINPANDFTTRLRELLINYPSIDPNAVGLELNWEKEPLWK